MIAKGISEAGHWYTRDGVPRYTVNSAKGIRPTTLRDARKMDLVPSVTTVIGVASKPGLMLWMQQQVLLAALTLPKIDTESEDEYISRIIADAKAQGRAAADAGTDIHGSIQAHYEGAQVQRHLEHVNGCSKAILETFGAREWVSERAFAHEIGYGGKVDMFCSDGIVLDIKTKEFTEVDNISAYDEHLMQLSAYRVGLGIPQARCGNVFVSRSVPGLVRIVEWSQDDLDRGWKMFMALLNYWQLKNGMK